MDEWLQRARAKTTHPGVRAIISFLFVLSLLMLPVSVASDTGFGAEVQRHRLLVWIIAVVVAAIVTAVWAYYDLWRKLGKNRIEMDQLRKTVETTRAERDRSEQEKESAFKLMQSYKAQTQEDIMSQLEQLAAFSIMKDNWREKEARVERLRTQQAAAIDSSSSELEIVERIEAIINLGVGDKVSEGMRFIVADPVDSYEYGRVQIRRVHEAGSTCSITRISNPAFWEKALSAAQEGRPSVSEASANALTPDSAIQDISSESAEELLVWLQKIRKVEL